jgi:hypothetical protein
MQVTSYRRIERRRSVRVTLAVPLRVDGQSVSGEEFIIRTQSHTVSQFGCLIPVDAEVAPDQTLVLMNENTRQSIQCRVVSTRRYRDGKKYLGVEFVTPAKANFWRIAFPKPGAKSLKTAIWFAGRLFGFRLNSHSCFLQSFFFETRTDVWAIPSRLSCFLRREFFVSSIKPIEKE